MRLDYICQTLIFITSTEQYLLSYYLAPSIPTVITLKVESTDRLNFRMRY